MERVEVPTNYLYEYIKDKSYHRMSDLDRAVAILSGKFLNTPEQIKDVLKDAIESDNPSKIYVIDRKYGYDGTISNMYKAIKPTK